MCLQGFKSFARKTSIPLANSMNVIVGPNGSGKSNITDALCFVLGRLSIKSIRAAKAANLLFSGNQTYKGTQEASVSLTFCNKDKTFALDSNEITIQRIVKKTGQSIYKINNKTQTRSGILELLSQAGIDSNGFNIVLQGEIQSLVKATPEERRKIIEEVAGISIYETRKQKTLKELSKTAEKLREISAILKERSSYLKNLDKERQEALLYQKLETTIRRCKKTILAKSLQAKQDDIKNINDTIQKIKSNIETAKKSIIEKNTKIEEHQAKISNINKQIQTSISTKQETLYKEISDLKAELAGLQVRKENFETRISQGKEKTTSLQSKIEKLKQSIEKIHTSSPEIKKTQEQQHILQKKIDNLETLRRKFYTIKADLSTCENQKSSYERSIIETKKESQLINNTISSLFQEVKHEKSPDKNSALQRKTKNTIEQIKEKISRLEKTILEKEKENAILEFEISKESKLKRDIMSLKSCPTCKQDVKEDHKNKISAVANDKIKLASKTVIQNSNSKKQYTLQINEFKNKLSELQTKLSELQIDNIKLENAADKKSQIKKLLQNQTNYETQLAQANNKKHSLTKSFNELKNIEEQYDETRLSLQEISFIDMDVDTEIQIKRREINHIVVESKTIQRDIEDSQVSLKTINMAINEKISLTTQKEKEERTLFEESKKFIDLRDTLQDQQKVQETELIGLQHTTRTLEDRINHNKITQAQTHAQAESIEIELKEFASVSTLDLPTTKAKEQLQKSQFKISRLGNVNLRALEIFDQIAEQVTFIENKVSTINQEKEQIEKIILEIDRKKKKAFNITLTKVNEFFTRNHTQLSRKGEVSLQLENKTDPFAGGLNILVKVSRGRYFDITSLSGGEKTMVALSLIFAIQEYRPYCFYIFDEIDAALDKHNSELLAALIKKYMTTGQYLVITHNDTLISEASNLYGVSMQEGMSKVVSLNV